ncbi:MAG: lysine--tRNA ligase [Eubacteriales bacterium]|nr:lysine--tRNA ligase [Eubacteriales bacterium]
MENTQNLSNEYDIRKEKINTLQNNGEIVYKERFDRTNTIKQARELGDGVKVRIAGRIIFRRVMGKFGFMQIRDLEAKIQVSVGINELNQEAYDFYKKMIDIGDFVGVDGELYTTQTGEVTVRANSVTLLSKALRPLPEKFHGLVDQEAKYRQRYLDLISNEEARKVFLGRSKMLAFIRKYLGENGFLEVETPILQTAVCGASARPFFTHHNALDKDLNLRIAPETYLKQCIAGGYDRVFEVAKCFRNEGMDTQHLQEFTQVEWYASYWNFEDNIKFFQGFIKNLLLELTGKTTIEKDGITLDFGKENFERINYVETMREVLGFDFLVYTDPIALKNKVVETGLFTMQDLADYKSVSQIIDFIYKKKIRENIVQPTILYNYPAVLIPLARRNDKDSRIIDVFQVVVMGTELCKAYSELVNPIQQRAAFEAQLEAKKQGDDETMDLDEGFMLAMEHGMPPISGLGCGLDRLLMLIYNQPSVRDVVLFPIMK